VQAPGILCGESGARDGFALFCESSPAVSGVSASAGCGSQVLLGPGCLARAMLRDSVVSVTRLPPLACKCWLQEMERPFPSVFLNKEGNPSCFSRLSVGIV